MKTINDVLERLDGESTAMVVQISAAECKQMHAIVQRELTPSLLEVLAAGVGAIAGEIGKAIHGANSSPPEVRHAPHPHEADE